LAWAREHQSAVSVTGDQFEVMWSKIQKSQ
jgi:hypothetical protein